MSILPTASFRGIPFYVRNIRDIGNGRNYRIHEYPNQKNPFIEDLGSKTLYFEFDGFLSNDNNLYMQRDLLEAALRVKGLGELIHPTRGMFKAACVEQEIGEIINEKGIVQLRLMFVAATQKPQFPLTPLGVIDTQGDLLEDAIGGLGDIGSSLGPLAGTLVSGAVSAAVSTGINFGISGIDSIFKNSTTGRYSQNTTNSTDEIKQKSSGNTDKQKLDSAKDISIKSNTNSKQKLTKSLGL